MQKKYVLAKVAIPLFLLFLLSCDKDNVVDPKISIDFPNSSTQSISVLDVNFLMKYVEGGTFFMGNKERPFENETPVHSVTLTKDYWIGETEVTQALWQAVMNNNPSCFQDKPKRPVERVSFYDAIMFCNKLSLLLGKEPVYSLYGEINPDRWGQLPNSLDASLTWDKEIVINYQAKGFRLPTEAEWEYAARGGKYSKNYKYSGTNDADKVVHIRQHYDGLGEYSEHGEYGEYYYHRVYPALVKSKIPNELGLYDMSGNVAEWCNDYYSCYDDSPKIDPKNETNISRYRVLRGGSWRERNVHCYVFSRNYYISYFRYFHCGFRIVLNS